MSPVNGVLSLAIVDDAALWLDLLRVSLTSGGLHVAAAFQTPEEALARWPSHIDVALLDVELGNGHVHGFELARQLRSGQPDLGIVFLTSVVDPWMIDEAASAALAGTSYLLKHGVGDLDQLQVAVKSAARGEIIVDPTILDALAGNGLVPSLTAMQARVMRCVAMGMSNAQIAEELGMSIKTVENSITRIGRALGVHNDGNLRVGCVTRYLALAVSGPHGAITR